MHYQPVYRQQILFYVRIMFSSATTRLHVLGSATTVMHIRAPARAFARGLGKRCEVQGVRRYVKQFVDW